MIASYFQSMNPDEKLPFLCSAESFSQLAKDAVIPTWRPLAEDENICFLVTNDRGKEALTGISDGSDGFAERVVSSFDSFVAEHETFGLLSCDGSDPAPADFKCDKEIIRIALANRRSNPDLGAFLETPFGQISDLIVSDYLPEESIVDEETFSEETCLEPTPNRFTFNAPVASSFSRGSKSNDGPLLWVVDPASMVSGPVNEKVATVLGKMEPDKQLQVFCVEPGAPANEQLSEQLSEAKGILAVTGDPALGHFLVRSACLLDIPIVFPIEEPCSPFRFTINELHHYLECNNYGRAGLSIRGLLSKAVARAKDWRSEKSSKDTELQSPESPSASWMRILAERNNGGATLPSSPSAHEILCLPTDVVIDAEPAFQYPPEVDDSTHDVSLVSKPWLSHPTFTKAVLALHARAQVPESVPMGQGIADLLSEHLLALKPTPVVAGRLFRNFSLFDPAWLGRTSEKFLNWRRDGIFLDVSRCLQASHPEISELTPGNLSGRKEEYQGLADLLTAQVNSHFFSPFIASTLFRFFSALDLVAERSDVILKVFAAYPRNERGYRSSLNFWGLVSGNMENCEGLAPDYSDSSNLVLSYGHVFLFTGMATGSLPDPDESVTSCLSNGYFEKWIEGSSWDRVIVSFVLSLIGLEEEAQKLFDEASSSDSRYSPFAHFLSKIPELRSSSDKFISDDAKENLLRILDKKG